MSSQERELTEQELIHLLHVRQVTGRPVIVDWVNRTISVLSEVKTNPKVQLSTGSMTYQDVLLRIEGNH